MCVCAHTWCSAKRSPSLNFVLGPILLVALCQCPKTITRIIILKTGFSGAFVKLKITKIIENYRSRIGKVHGPEITFNAIMCLLAIIFYYFVLPKAQFVMVLLKGIKSSW